MTSLLLCLSWIHSTIVTASPFPDASQAPTTSNSVSTSTTSYRTTLDLIWSCLAIISATTYVCVHPNVPGYKATWKQRLIARVKISAVAIFSPEIIALYAFYQQRGSRLLHEWMKGQAESLEIPLKIGKKEEPAWTYVHAHFLQMGGIAFKQGDEVYFSEPSKWNEEQIRAFFNLLLTEDAILDKSKGDALAKSLVILQVLWFLVQSIARWIQGLPLALLEAACLAFTVFGMAIYYFWWNKPLNITYPIEVTCKNMHKWDYSSEHELDTLERVLNCLRDLSKSVTYLGTWQSAQATTTWPSIYWHCAQPQPSELDNNHIDEVDGYVILAFSLITSSLGALHAMAWFFHFPTIVEKYLWRVACLVLALQPIGHVLLCFILEAKLFSKVLPFFKRKFPAFTRVAMQAGMVVGVSVYAAARTILLVLPFLQLRDLPEAIHQTIAWANFLPHI